MNEPRYSALRKLWTKADRSYLLTSEDAIAIDRELANAERMAQPAPCGKLEHSGTLTFSGARGPECLLCSQTAEIERRAQQVAAMQIQLNAANDEIERLRGQVKELELQRVAKPWYPTLVARITEYLYNGGLWNPEHMEHDKVRALLIDCQDKLFDIERMAQQFDAQHALLTRLAGSANEIKGMIERNELIRNIQADIKSDYIQRMMVFVQRLQKFDAAIAEAHAAGVVTE